MKPGNLFFKVPNPARNRKMRMGYSRRFAGSRQSVFFSLPQYRKEMI